MSYSTIYFNVQIISSVNFALLISGVSSGTSVVAYQAYQRTSVPAYQRSSVPLAGDVLVVPELHVLLNKVACPTEQGSMSY